MIQVKGTHPYADMFPMASPDELDELTASVASVGLIQPVVLTPEGLVLDGRNRVEACKRAGVEPDFVTREGSDDDYKEFVIGVNTTGRRESMTVQIAAAATALILGAEKRINGQWRRGALGEDLHLTEMKKALAQAGLVLDVLGTDALERVRDGEETLNHAYELARDEKQRREDEERRKVEEARDEQAREDKAGRYFDNHPEAKAWLDSKPQGAFETMRGAYAAYMEHDREARRIEAEKRKEEEKRQRELDERYGRTADRLRDFINGHHAAVNLKTNPDRKQILAKLTDYERNTFLEIEESLHA